MCKCYYRCVTTYQHVDTVYVYKCIYASAATQAHRHLLFDEKLKLQTEKDNSFKFLNVLFYFKRFSFLVLRVMFCFFFTFFPRKLYMYCMNSSCIESTEFIIRSNFLLFKLWWKKTDMDLVTLRVLSRKSFLSIKGLFCIKH